MKVFRLQYWLKSTLLSNAIHEKLFTSLSDFYDYRRDYLEKGIFDIGLHVKDCTWTLMVGEESIYGIQDKTLYDNKTLYHNQIDDINLKMDQVASYKEDILAIKLELDQNKKLEDIQKDIESGKIKANK